MVIIKVQTIIYFHYRYFQTAATKLLDLCWNKDRLWTSDMLVRVSDTWGNCTALDLAHKGSLEDFMAAPACAAKLQKIMYGDLLVTTPIYKVGVTQFYTISSFKIRILSWLNVKWSSLSKRSYIMM